MKQQISREIPLNPIRDHTRCTHSHSNSHPRNILSYSVKF